jgi:hypothetical protein
VIGAEAGEVGLLDGQLVELGQVVGLAGAEHVVDHHRLFDGVGADHDRTRCEHRLHVGRHDLIGELGGHTHRLGLGGHQCSPHLFESAVGVGQGGDGGVVAVECLEQLSFDLRPVLGRLRDDGVGVVLGGFGLLGSLFRLGHGGGARRDSPDLERHGEEGEHDHGQRGPPDIHVRSWRVMRPTGCAQTRDGDGGISDLVGPGE